jgi:hypothetical protein
MSANDCDHKGLSAFKVYWMRGTFYIVCRRCGADLRDRIDPAVNKLN